MKKPYRFYELTDTQFEDIVVKICVEVLGTGTFRFAKGRDGGRDGRFEGTAKEFPSPKSPLSGKFIIQAKHTSDATASCSDPKFDKVLDDEEPKISRLANDGELEYYLLFTNRRVTGGKDKEIRQHIKEIPFVIDAFLFGDELISTYLDLHEGIWKSLGFDQYISPLRIVPDDLGCVIRAFYDSREGIISAIDSARDFRYLGLSKKNEVNGLSEEYYNHMITDSLPSFGFISDFLENPRNKLFKEQYHSTADEMKFKLIQARSHFNTFDDVLTHLYDLVVDGNPDLSHRRQLAHVFLHYMYFSCDIGKND